MSLLSSTAFLSETVFLSLPLFPLFGVRDACISGSDMDLGRVALCAGCSGISADCAFFFDFALTRAGV